VAHGRPDRRRSGGRRALPAAPAWTDKPASAPAFLPERAQAQAARRLQALAITPAMGALINDAQRQARAWSTLERREADATATLTRAARIKGYEHWAPTCTR